MYNTIAYIYQAASHIHSAMESVIGSVAHAIDQLQTEIFGYLFACIWCGVAFLRSLVDTPTQMRDKAIMELCTHQE
ncbi:hypothetical protein [Crenobacter caeni]|uniref:Uncharacterized protein n=1 Tax=Crenobacter caeni TaxID=2705474 RepID=A0A6B2KRX2_9NEIS|nr:hypothetical protein [Crenobacter caeni]NDV12996.1 hypothetical protein [Crenobacter caeni]